jgi:beta-xylosidase
VPTERYGLSRPAALAAACALALWTAPAQAQNPIMRGADPHAIVLRDTVWIYPTQRSAEGLFFAHSSTDLVNWVAHGPILRFSEIDWIPAGKHAWAPALHVVDGRYFLYYSVGPKPSHIGVAVGDSPAGPFTDSGRPLLSDHNDPGFEAIDPFVFTDPVTGRSYLYAGGSSGSTLRVFELADDMISFAREIAVENPPNFTEGPSLHYLDGVYHLTYSHGSWRRSSYSVHHATAPTPTGPWTYRGPILASDDRHKGPGHHSVIQNPRTGEWLIVYHRWNDREGDGPYTGSREVAIDRLVHEEGGRIRTVVMTDEGVTGWIPSDSIRAIQPPRPDVK